MYYAGAGDVLRSFGFVNGQLVQTGEGSNAFEKHGASPVVSSDGVQNGVVWVISSADQLIAYNAMNLSSELWATSLPGYSTFSIPDVTGDGHVEVGAGSVLVGFGLRRHLVNAVRTSSLSKREPLDLRALEDLREASAVDGEAGTGDVAAGFTGEEQCGADQLIGRPQRPRAVRRANLVRCSFERRLTGRSVKNGPGAMQLTVTPNGPSSLAVARARPRSAVLVAEYACGRRPNCGP